MSRRASWLPLAAALAACMFGAATEWPAFVRGWFVAALTWGVLPVGAVAVLMTHGLTGGAWGRASRHVWIALAAAMPVIAAAMLPLLLGLDELFPWTLPPAELPEAVRLKLAYLNEPFFVARTFVYLGVWLSLPWLLGVWGRPSRAVHAPGLIAWVLVVTFFGVDWLMSLEPTFYSDVFGIVLVTGTAAATLAAGLLLAVARAPCSIRVDLANLWLAALVSWALATFSQLIVIWSGNLPDEVGWYVRRAERPWAEIGWVALALFFALPVAILLSTAAKRQRAWLVAASASCLAGYALYVHWLVLPAFERQLPAQLWLEPAAFVVVGAGVALSTRRRLKRAERVGDG